MDIYLLVGNVSQYSSDDFQQENTEQQTQILHKRKKIKTTTNLDCLRKKNVHIET